MNDPIAAIAEEALGWRKRLHRRPELGFQETETADFVAERLIEAGLEVIRGIAGTGVAGRLRAGASGRRILFRAELDALPIQERTGLEHASEHPGRMHACGHDGHAAILMGAAKSLSQEPNFDGEILFLFQPAEEVHGGGRQVVAEGLLDRFPVEAAYALHNWPGLAEGVVAAPSGPIMAAVDDFTLAFRGAGAHAAMPHLGDDPMLAAAEMMLSAQRVVSRSVDPQEALVLSFTQIRGGRINNIVPGEVELQGTARFFQPAFSAHVSETLRRMADGIAAAHGVCAELDYRRGYPAVVNRPNGAELARRAALSLLPSDKVVSNVAPSMGCEDFSHLLDAVGDGAYVWLGAGAVGPGEGLHGDRYVFNDALTPLGLRFWRALAETALPRRAL